MLDTRKAVWLFSFILIFCCSAVGAEEVQKPLFYQERETRLVEIKLKPSKKVKNFYTNSDLDAEANCQGVIIESGLIITAAHCVDFPDFLIIINNLLPAKILGILYQPDLALLEASVVSDFDRLPLNLSPSLKNQLFAVRKPYNSGFFWHQGQLTRISKTEINFVSSNFFSRTGDSGTPLYAKNGSLVGIHLGHLKNTMPRVMYAAPAGEIKKLYQESKKK